MLVYDDMSNTTNSAAGRVTLHLVTRMDVDRSAIVGPLPFDVCTCNHVPIHPAHFAFTAETCGADLRVIAFTGRDSALVVVEANAAP